jgi:hypothetical protein
MIIYSGPVVHPPVLPPPREEGREKSVHPPSPRVKKIRCRRQQLRVSCFSAFDRISGCEARRRTAFDGRRLRML